MNETCETTPDFTTEEERLALIVEVAKDVLVSIELGRIKPSHGTYLGGILDQQVSFEVGEDVQQHIPEFKECRVCALGASMLSLVHLKNHAKVAERGRFAVHDALYTMMNRRLSCLLGSQYRMIEAAFEGYVYPSMRGGREFRCNSMQSIMQNIIDNGGVFVPTPEMYFPNED